MARLKKRLNYEEVQRIRSNLNVISNSIQKLEWDRASWIEIARDMLEEGEFDLVIDHLTSVRGYDDLISSLEMIKKTIEEEPKEVKSSHNALGQPLKSAEKDKHGNSVYDLDDVVDYDEITSKKTLN